MIIVLLFQYGKTAYDMAVSIEKRVCTFVCHAIDMLQRLKIIYFNNNIADWTISCLIDQIAVALLAYLLIMFICLYVCLSTF